jgi:hypothetical protein
MIKTMFGSVVLGLVSACAADAQQTSAELWRRDAEALTGRPELVRFYSFVSGDAVQSNRAGLAADMKYRPDKGSALTTGVGRVAGMTAALLDGDSFEAPAVSFSSNAFSVALWLRPLAMGSKTGNAGSVNGMIVSSGSGYNDGWRLAVYDWRTRQPSFELGQEKGAVSVKACDGLSAGFWNHLAATWDGAVMRLFINGMLVGEKPFEGTQAAPKGTLKLGFSGYGVGSLRMAVDELAVFSRALSPAEVVDLSLSGVADGVAAKRVLASLDTARRSGSHAELADVCAAAFENPAVPAHLRGQAVEALVGICRQGSGGTLSSRVLAKLPEHVTMDAEGQRMFALALGASLVREGNVDGAVRVYEQVLTAADASPLDCAEVRQRCAQALRQAGRWEAARAQYAATAADVRLPLHVRGLAALSVAQTWQAENKLAEAITAYRAVVEATNQIPHLAREAEACEMECANRLAGKPGRDPEANRERLQPLPEPAVAFFIAPAGSDEAAGTIEKPFATLARARDAVRACKVNGQLPPGGAAVYLRGGTYAVTNTFTLTEADSGNYGAPVVYRAWRDERPVLDGGFRLKRFGFKKVRDPDLLARLPPEARANVRVVDVKTQGYRALAPQTSYGYGLNNKTVRELYQDGAPLQIARWPNVGTVKIAEVLDATNHVFACQTERLSRWTGAPDLMANGYWLHLWAGCTVPVKAIDSSAGTLTLKEKPGYGMAKDRPFYVLNLLEELDRPGEWYLDVKAGLLYVWPVRHPWLSEIVLTRWSQPFIEVKDVQEVVFQGLTLEYGQQHGLVLNGSVNTVIARCVIRRMGGTALTALNSANLKIYGNLLYTLGHTGMHVSGGNRKNLTSGRIVIENNEVRDFGRLSRTYNPALLLEGCGTRVAHNWFHDAPSSAMRIEGNDHLIEYNRVDHVVQESDDQGGIDMWGNPSYRGVVIRFNRWQDIGGGEIPCGQAGIRFDDAISGLLVYGNLFERTSNGHFGGVQIHGGQNNIIDNNLFVGCRYGVSFSAWGQKRWQEYLMRDNVRKLLLADVNVGLAPYLTRYPALLDLGVKADINSIWRNVFVGAEQALYKKPRGTDDWDNQVYAMQPEMGALSAQTPFRPLPCDEMGPYEDPAKARE